MLLNTKVRIATAVVLGLAVIAVAGVGAHSAQAAYMHTLTLKMGSNNLQVKALQQTLNANGYVVATVGAGSPGLESTFFGPKTFAAVKAFQAAHGLKADGVVGPITGGALAALTGGMTGNFPPGCTSAAGFSSTTGNPCNGGTNPNNTDTTLHGGAGDITVTERNSGTDDQVLEGDTKDKVVGFEVKPDGSDVAITSVRVEFEHTGTLGSDRLDRYAQKVYILQGGKVVGSADVSDFNKSSNIYSRNIAVSGATVRDNQTARFDVAIDAESNIDTNDKGTNWEAGVGAIRFRDATGAILTDDTGTGVGGDITNTFTFEDLASGGDVKLTVSEDNSSVNDAHTETVNDTSDTNDIDLLSFTLKSKSTDTTVNTMAFDVGSSGAGVTEIFNDFRVMMGGNEVGNVSVFSGVAGANGDCSGTDVGFASTTDTSVCLQVTDLDEDNVTINEGSTEKFTLVADANDIGGAFTSGDTASSTLNADNIDAEDTNGDQISSSDLVGSADSGPVTFISTGIALDPGSADTSDVTTINTTTGQQQATYVVNFNVTAVEDDVWIALTAASSTSATPSTAGAEYFVESPSADDVAVGTTGQVSSGVLERVSGGSQDGNYLKITSGQTASLRLTVTYTPAATGPYRAQLYAVNFANSKVAGTAQMLALPTFDYQSPSENVHQ